MDVARMQNAHNSFFLFLFRMPIKIMKTKIKKNLQNLELNEVVTRKNGYQDLVNMIAQVSKINIKKMDIRIWSTSELE